VSGPTITGEVRLDNRDELLRALDVNPEERGRITDLALILRAHERWGEACAPKLLGDFAFVVHDDRTRRTFGARDHLGVKPFYYRASEGGLAFATRASAIPEADGLPLELDEARVADVCLPDLECVDLTSTFYRGVSRLPPAHRLTFEAGRVVVAPYWTPDPSREIRFASDDDTVDAFREVFTEAVRCRLAGSTASMLSGGLDSSAIVGFARSILRENGGPLTTLSAVTDEPGCVESSHIRAVSGLPGLDPVMIRPGDVPSFRQEIETFVETMEEPFDDSMMIPLLVYAAARRRGLGAVLDGVDGDCVASHEPHILAGLLRAGRWGTAFREARGFARFYDGTFAPWSSAARLLAVNTARAFAPGFVRVALQPLRQRRGVSQALAESLISRDCAARVDVAGRLAEHWSHRDLRRMRTARSRQAVEVAHPQIAAALERYHRVAASQGIEARHPFFDKRLVEFCLALPWDQKVREGWSKWIVRTASAGVLPDAVRWRRGRWVALGERFLAAAIQASDAFVRRQMSGGLHELAPYVDLVKLRDAYDRYRRRGEVNDASRVWMASILSFWLRKTRLSRYDPPARKNGRAALPRVSLTR
jgi:asparagine synthase (glutamine-hydrolysing)